MSLEVTPIYAAILGLLLLYLAKRVVDFRQRDKVTLGAGDSKDLELAIRVHCNATEYIPILLVLLLTLELSGAPAWLVHVGGGLTLVARLLHAVGLGGKRGPSFGRFWGTALTWLTLLSLAIANLVYLFL